MRAYRHALVIGGAALAALLAWSVFLSGGEGGVKPSSPWVNRTPVGDGESFVAPAYERDAFGSQISAGLNRIESDLKNSAVSGALPIRVSELRSLWSAYLNAGAAPTDRAILGKRLSLALRGGDAAGSEVYEEIRGVLAAAGGDAGVIMRIGRILSETDTTSALDILLSEITKNASNPDIARQLLRFVAPMNSVLGHDSEANAMSRRALEYWTEFERTERGMPGLFGALAGVIARGGTQEGIRFLQSRAEIAAGNLEGASNSQLEAALAALGATGSVRRVSAVPALRESLRANDPKQASFLWAGDALANLGDPLALQALIEWASGAPDACANVAGRWIGRARDSRSQEFLVSAFAGNGPAFVSAAVRDSVLSAAAMVRERVEVEKPKS